MTAPPSSIVIPASPLDAKLLSASSLSWAPPSTAHPSTLHPLAASAPSTSPGDTPRGGPTERHFITKRQFEQWRGSHPGESQALRPRAGSEGMDKMILQGYRAPQHPASHVLQSIPPRAPSRSSRSNILSYTLHLATSSRLSSYSAPNGTRTLLHWAEQDAQGDGTRYEDVKIDAEWFETEQKTQGLWTLGVNLLQSSRREGSLPPSVERRVALAGLAEELLVSPAGDRAITKIDEESVHPSIEVEELASLKPLTSPDTTTLYLSTSTHAASARTPRDRSHSVAQSLIDLKFGGAKGGPEAPSISHDETMLDTSTAEAVPGSSVFGQPGLGPPSSPHELTATPHMDYRIVLSQSMRIRAKTIFASSPLPSLTTSFCRRHRVSACSVCTTLVLETSERASDHARQRRRNIPGAGLRSHLPVGSAGDGGGSKKALVALVPTFLKISADLLSDLADRLRSGGKTADGIEESDYAASTVSGATSVEKGGSSNGPNQIHVTSAWYDLLTLLLTQACLEGYLVDGWTGTEGIETLFGVGCGVWEGRGWSTAGRPVAFSQTTATEPRTRTRPEERLKVDSSDDVSDGEMDDEVECLAREREQQTMRLVEAAHALFGSRDVAQADYERGMRDRIHEFLNVPRDKSLIQHLAALSTKYPLSAFEDDMVDFLECALRTLGKPALAKLHPATNHPSSPSPGSASRSSSFGREGADDADPFALIQYFSHVPNTAAVTPDREGPNSQSPFPQRPWEDETGAKRRRVD